MTSLTRDGQVEFRFFRPNVGSVELMGDFNDWNPRGLPMRSEGAGWWSIRLGLNPGEYRFRYLADGQWFNDYAAYGIELTRTGYNSVLLVPESNEALPESIAPSKRVA